MSELKNILIAGAGIAGPACSIMLARTGHKVTNLNARLISALVDSRLMSLAMVYRSAGVSGFTKNCWPSPWKTKGRQFVDDKYRSWADFNR